MTGANSKLSVWDEERLRAAANAAGIAIWSWEVSTGEVGVERAGRALWGLPMDGPLTLEALFAQVHPDDAERVRTAFATISGKPGSYEFDFRVLRDDGTIWLSARGLGNDEGNIEGVAFGVFLDVTERRQAADTHELLAREMSHRIKNLFAIASGLTAIAARSAATTTEMARDLSQRLTTLGRAQDLIRPDPGQAGRKAAFLSELLAVFLAPYDAHGAIGDRIHVTVPEVSVGELSTTTLALVVHELATNSIKYGSLSLAGGTLDVSCTATNGEIVLVWTERGGPPVAAPTRPGGFGTKLMTQSLSGQLDGSIAFDWSAESVIVTLRMNKARLSR